jgi:hypothetical protein
MLGSIIAFIGFVIMLIFGIQILIIAFKKSILWGLGSLFIPFVGLVFVFMHWADCKTPFMRWLIGFAVSVVGGILTAVLGGGAG